MHRATAVLGLTCLATAAALYLEPIAELVGRRALVVQSTSGPGSRCRCRSCSAGRRGRSGPTTGCSTGATRIDRDWLRRRDRRTARLPVGKFNAGQKLNASLSAGAGLVLLGTGIVLEYGRRWPLDLRIGATFVHDWTAFAVLVLVVGHIWFASNDEDARRGIWTGRVPVGWALREHPAWAGGLLTGLLPAAAGEDRGMDPDQERVRHRADELLPEERAAGSDDPLGQAAAILADSDEREYDPDAAPDTMLERRTSAEATDPPD